MLLAKPPLDETSQIDPLGDKSLPAIHRDESVVIRVALLESGNDYSVVLSFKYMAVPQVKYLVELTIENLACVLFHKGLMAKGLKEEFFPS